MRLVPHSGISGARGRGRPQAVLTALALLLAAFSGAADCSSPAPASPDPRFRPGRLLYSDDFQHGLSRWVVEAERPAHVTASHGVLDIDTPAGLTVWFKSELRGPVLIEYEAVAVSAGGPDDRVSDLNCFWMATDPHSLPGQPPGRRSGAFADYNNLFAYYVGLGGNGNTTTRFRRYIGSETERPLLPTNDRSSPEELLHPNRPQMIRLVAADSVIQYYRDGQRLFQYDDPRPYTHGWFAFRTTQSHLQIRNFRVYRLTAQPAFDFDFGSSGTNYDAQRGFGIEPGVSGSKNVRFSVKVPEGNFRVTLRLRPDQATPHCTVKAEARRLLTEDLSAGADELRERTFIVNVRTPLLAPPPPNAPGANAVRLKPREIDSPTWDDKLTLEFLGCANLIDGLSIEPARVPTVYLVGDSTVTDQPDEPAASWGQMLPRFFAPDVAVANHAESGETLKSFLAELRLDKVLSRLAPGDWLLIQFGHNDQKAQWPQTYVEAATTYRAYLRTYIAEARRRGATPVLITSPERRNFDQNGHIIDSLGDYPEAVRSVAREDAVALIDLNAMSKAFYEALGPERAARAFNEGGRDRTHHDNYGAYELARMIVSGIAAAGRSESLESPGPIGDLARHLVPDAAAFDPRHPDPPEHFELAVSDAHETNPIAGN